MTGASERSRPSPRRALFADGIDSDRARRAARFDMLWPDHGFLRAFYANAGPVGPGVTRSNQPSPGRLARLAGQGLRTVVNLRGATLWGSYALERDACARLGLVLIDYPVFAYKAPQPAELIALAETIERAEKPLLLHCKSGADRTALAAIAWLLLAQGAPLDQARGHLSRRWLHLKGGRAGILDAFLALYARTHAASGVSLHDWLVSEYDPAALQASYRPRRLGRWLADTLLRRELGNDHGGR